MPNSGIERAIADLEATRETWLTNKMQYSMNLKAQELIIRKANSFALAITALQAQIKPECEWCKDGEYFILDVGLARYCPNCGRELKGGE